MSVHTERRCVGWVEGSDRHRFEQLSIPTASTSSPPPFEAAVCFCFLKTFSPNISKVFIFFPAFSNFFFSSCRVSCREKFTKYCVFRRDFKFLLLFLFWSFRRNPQTCELPFSVTDVCSTSESLLVGLKSNLSHVEPRLQQSLFSWFCRFWFSFSRCLFAHQNHNHA